MPWQYEVLVEDIDGPHHTLDVMVSIPLGVILFNHVTCQALDSSTTQLSFSCEYTFTPLWWGWLMERVAGQWLYRQVATVVERIKQAAETAA